jgi:hypothetical protein
MNQELVDRCLTYLEMTTVAPIQSGMELDLETITELARRVVQNKDIRAMFATGDGLPMSYICEVKCDRCEAMQKRALNKTQLISYMELIRRDELGVNKRACQTVATCGICKDKEEAEKKATRIQTTGNYQRALHKNKEENTTRIITGFLMPSAQLKEGKTWVDAERELRSRLNNCDHEQIAQEIKDMEYGEFLQTPYWKIISFLVKKQHEFKCVMCNSKENLHVHHKSYELHGLEHTQAGFAMLTSVCADCHSKHHEIES